MSDKREPAPDVLGPAQQGPAASLIHDGRRLPLERELTIGRAEDNDVVVSDERASRRHARVWVLEDGFWLADMGSRHGTLLNGEPVAAEPRELASGDEIQVGEAVLRFLSGPQTRMASREQAVVATRTVGFDGERLTVGRDERNDLVLPDPNVSRFHAEVVAVDGETEVMDLGSRNGTRVNGEPVERAVLDADSQIGIGPFRLLFDGRSCVARDDRGALRLVAQGLAVRAGDKQILAPTDLAIEPGEFVVLIGESGAGKSTLLKALAGVNAPSSGRVTVNGEPVAARLTDIGYVPQDEIVHALLKVREAMDYAARLRLPRDVAEQEVRAAVDRVIEELSLQEHADTLIGSLSGGQRKRAGVASELLNRPSLLFLDEPTTGLDPGLETQMMQLLRRLADRGRAVAVVTHATKNLALCDRVVVMGRGGVMTFQGSPDEALRFFGVDDYDGIYPALAGTPPAEWRRRFEEGAGEPVGAPDAALALPEPELRRRRQGRPVLPQAAVLTRRYLKLFTRDRRNVALLLGQAPVLALFNVALFKSGVFGGAPGTVGDSVQLLFLLAITVIWLGSIDAAPEIVKERAVFEREGAIGTRLSAYLISKLVVLFSLVAVQVLLYAGVTLALRPLDEPTGTYAGVLAILLLTGFAAAGMGLLVSSLVSKQEQAMSLIPLAVIPQLLFAGTLVPLARMAEPAHSIAYAIFSQWSLASLGTEVDMNARMAADPEFSRVNRFGRDFFDVALGAGLLVQLVFLAVFLAAVAVVLRR